MKQLSFVILIVSILIGCKQTRNDNADSQPETEKNEKKNMTLDNIDFKQLPNVTPNLTIMEYEQWDKLLETVITDDGLFRYEKNWQNGEIKREILHIESKGLFTQIEQILLKDFSRSQDYYEDWSGNSYFLHLRIKRTEDLSVNISFKNCKSKELEQLISVINQKLPEGEHIVLKGKNVIDNFVAADSINTWNSLKSIARYNSVSLFKLRNIDRNIIPLLDSTKFGACIYKAYSLKSSFLVSVRENIGKYYPCIILGEQYESDDIVKFLAVFMIDSTFNKTGDFEFISSFGTDSEGEWDYFGTFKDSLLQIDRESIFECYDGIEGISKLHVQEQFKLTADGQINEIKTDTLEIKYCK